MRNGHLYKIEGMLKGGATEEEILHAFRNAYPAEHVRQFLPKERKTIRKKRVAKATTDE